MPTAPVILLPPSEGKAEGGTGPKLKISGLSFPQLEKQREVRVLKEGNDNNKPSPRLQANNDNEREVQALQDSKAIVSL